MGQNTETERRLGTIAAGVGGAIGFLVASQLHGRVSKLVGLLVVIVASVLVGKITFMAGTWWEGRRHRRDLGLRANDGR